MGGALSVVISEDTYKNLGTREDGLLSDDAFAARAGYSLV
jgi:hypothetical protein